MILSRQAIGAASLAMAFALVGCGGASNGGANAPPPIAAPAPAPAPSPTPTPMPTPSPSPAPSGPAIAGAVPGQSLSAPLVCGQGDATFAAGSMRLTDFDSIVRTYLAVGYLDIAYRGGDTFDLVFGFDDVGTMRPADKRSPLSSACDYFDAGNGFELELYRNALSQQFRSITLGRTNFVDVGPGIDGAACFFAAGLGAPPPPTAGAENYAGFVDGLSLQNGDAMRLFGSVATATIDYAARTGTVQIDLRGRGSPFGEFLNATPTSIGRAQAQFTIPASSSFIPETSLTGPSGSSGSITGQLFAGGAAVGFIFELRFPNGDRLFGAAAVERPAPGP